MKTQSETTELADPRARIRLTRRAIDSLTFAGAGKQRDVRWDDEVRGLGIRIYPSGRKSFVILYRVNRMQRMMVLGDYPTLTPEAARRDARLKLADVLRGEDPLRRRQQERAAETVDELAAEYIEHHAKRHKRSWQKDQSILERDVAPRIGKLKASDVRRRDVIALLEKVYARSPIMANRTLEVVRKMFNYGISRDVLEYNPCYGISKLAKEVRRDQWLSADAIKQFWTGLDQAEMTPQVRAILKLILLLGQRPGEVAGMTVGELDLADAGAWWTVPAERSKNGLAHRVPLPPLALELLAPFQTPRLDPAPRRLEPLFTRMLGQPIKVSALAHAIKRNRELLGVEDFRPHDLRRTAASHMSAMGISRLVVGKILNHVERDITSVYDRYGYDREKRQALEAWAEQLQELIERGGRSHVVEFTKKEAR